MLPECLKFGNRACYAIDVARAWQTPKAHEARSTANVCSCLQCRCLCTHLGQTGDCSHRSGFSLRSKAVELTSRWGIAWDRKDESTWLAITGPTVIADYTDYPAVGTLRVASPGELFQGSFSVTQLGDKRRTLLSCAPGQASAGCRADDMK